MPTATLSVRSSLIPPLGLGARDEQRPQAPHRLYAWLGIGAAYGVVQWLMLRSHIRRAGWWVVATPAAFLVASSLTLSLSDSALFSEGVAAAVMGATVGVLQWPVLKKDLRSRALWWIPIEGATRWQSR
jgi:membrane associated rhomboid family serine protease